MPGCNIINCTCGYHTIYSSLLFLCVFFSCACCSSVSWQELSSGLTAKCFEFSQLLYDIYNDDLIQLQHCACVMLTVI